MAKRVMKKSVKKATKAPAKKGKAVKKSTAKKPAAKKPAAKKAVKKATRPTPAKPATKATPATSTLRVGAKAPGFKLASSLGRTVSLSDYAGKTVVVYFYPRADTPGCTTEACGFRDAIADYARVSTDVVGISPDPVSDVKKFAEKFGIGFPLLADENHAVCEAYGVWVEKSMYGKKYMGAARSTFIVHDGVVKRVFEKVNPEGHHAEVLEALKSLA